MPDPVTVAHLLPSLAPTGPVRVALDLVKWLDRSRYVPVLVPLKASSAACMESCSRACDAEVRTLGTRWWLGGRKAVGRLLRDVDASIVHAHCYAPMLVAAALPRTVPRIVTVHNWPWLDYRETYGAAKGALMWGFERRLLRSFDAVVPCSRNLARELRQRGCAVSSPIQNGVDPVHFSVAGQEQRAAARRALGLPQNAVVFVYTGQLSALKRVLPLVAGYISAGLDNARLVVVGDGPLASSCAALAAGRGDIVVTGFRSDVALILAAADVYVSAAVTEGLPLSVIEAYRAGLRLLLSDIPAHREVLEGKDDAGRLFQSTEDLGRVMRLECERLSSVPGANAGREHFSALDMARQYQVLYDQLGPAGQRLPGGDIFFQREVA